MCFAQTKTENSNKIAAIDTNAFFDESTGIEELVIAKRKLDQEFEPYNQDLASSHQKVEQCINEIKKISEFMNSPEPKPQVNFGSNSMRDRASKCENLDKEREELRDKIKTQYEKRKLETFTDINKKVENAIKVFVKQNGYSIVLDSSKINSSAIIEGESVDITKDFIHFYNEQFVNKEMQ